MQEEETELEKTLKEFFKEKKYYTIKIKNGNRIVVDKEVYI